MQRPRDHVVFSTESSIEILERTPATLAAVLHGVGDAWARSNEGGDSFSPFDVVGHLIDGEETDWIPRARIILERGKNITFEPYDRFRHRRRNAGRDLTSLLAEFELLRSENVKTLRSWNLTEEQLGLPGEHPQLGVVTLRNLLATWVVHDLGHIAQVTRVMAKQYAEAVGPWRAYLPVLSDRATPGLQEGVSTIGEHEFPDVVQVWEDAVRATHHFLTDERIREFRPLVRDKYLQMVDLACVRTVTGRIAGFVGTADGKVEMLFVAPHWFHRGVGRRLMDYAIRETGSRLVDVNEQNTAAVEFYRTLGYEVISRSPVDGMGLPYPILHMRLAHQ